MCLFKGEIGQTENFGEKMEKKNFFGVCFVGWGERKINGGVWMFYPRAHQKVFSSKWRENYFFFLFFHFCVFLGTLPLPFFLILFFSFPRCCLLFSFLFLFISWAVGVIVFFLFFIFLTRHDFIF